MSNELRVGSLFSGYGGLDMAVAAVFGARMMWHAEINPAAEHLLKYRYPDVPNIGDITTADWEAINFFRPIDILCGGWPCQPFSLAGKQLGAEDERALWPHVARAIRLLRPRFVVLENVSAVLTAGEFDRVAADLAELGYQFSWVCLRASDVGATHRRNRLFILAWDTTYSGRDAAQLEDRRRERAGEARGSDLNVADPDGQRLARTEQPAPRRSDPADDIERCDVATSDAYGARREVVGPVAGEPQLADAVGGWDIAADAEGDGRHEGRPEPAGQLGGPDVAECGGATLADSDGDGFAELGRELTSECDVDGRGGAERDGYATESTPSEAHPDAVAVGCGTAGWDDGVRAAGLVARYGTWGDYEPAIRRWERVLGRVAPAPTELNSKGGQRLAPRFVEWMMGLPAGWVTDVPGISRNDQLKMLGNGVVPQQATEALLRLGVRHD